MQKIPTIFERDGSGRVTPEYAVDPARLREAYATEKVDGTNVRLTVRNHTLVRLEARKNPSKMQKQSGMAEPWYRDAWHIVGFDAAGDSRGGFDAADQYIVEAAVKTDLSNVADGEWPGEAVGPKIQGNPLGLELRHVFLFSHPAARRRAIFAPHQAVPTDYGVLREWLPTAWSFFNPEVPIEGVVWWIKGEPIGKIKAKDFPR